MSAQPTNLINIAATTSDRLPEPSSRLSAETALTSLRTAGAAVPEPRLALRAQYALLRTALAAMDCAMLLLAVYLAYRLRFDFKIALSPEVAGRPEFYGPLAAGLLPLWLGLLAVFGLYSPRYLMGGTEEYARAFNACTTGILLVIVVVFADPTVNIARGWLAAAWTLSIVLVCLGRFLIRRAVYRLRRHGYFVHRAAIVGVNGEARALAEELRNYKASGLNILGFIANHSWYSRDEAPILGSLDDIGTTLQDHRISDVIVAATALDRRQLLDLFEEASALPDVELRLSSGLYEVLTTGVRVKQAGFVPLMSLNKVRLEPMEAALKTVMDYTLATLGVIALLPVFAALALIIKLDSPGPVFYRRRVLGVCGKEFDAFKFRTMHVNGEQILAFHPELQAQLRATQKLKQDPRVTRVGGVLRKYSLDELPQLFNVLLGQMSLVGPRMISPSEAALYGHLRTNLLTVKPGLSGLWQTSGRSDVSYEERIQLDMHYIRNYTIWRDLQILFIQTVPAVLKGRGAY